MEGRGLVAFNFSAVVPFLLPASAGIFPSSAVGTVGSLYKKASSLAGQRTAVVFLIPILSI